MFDLGKPNTLCIATHIAQICKHMWFLDPACSCMNLFSQALVLNGIQGFPIVSGQSIPLKFSNISKTLSGTKFLDSSTISYAHISLPGF